MDSKVLTLFDDEDFQQPTPKPKAGKREKSREVNEPVDVSVISNDVSQDVVIDIEDDSKKDTGKEGGGSGEEKTADKETDNSVLDAQMRAALIQVDYAQYVYKEMPAQPKQQVMGSGIVFEGVVKAKKSEPKTNIVIEEQSPVEETIAEDEMPDEGLPEWQLESRYYAIGEVAKLFGVNTSHIRFWTTQFKLKPRTTRKGDRLYNIDDINQLRLIHHLVKEKKHTIKGAKEKLRDKDLVAVNLDLKASLSILRGILIEIKDKL